MARSKASPTRERVKVSFDGDCEKCGTSFSSGEEMIKEVEGDYIFFVHDECPDKFKVVK